jgi:hypothetical protein
MSYDNVNAGCAGVAVFNPNTNTCSIAGRSGFGIVYDLVSSGGSAFTMGSWAVTSP